jgi:hypothetical protein
MHVRKMLIRQFAVHTAPQSVSNASPVAAAAFAGTATTPPSM